MPRTNERATEILVEAKKRLLKSIIHTSTNLSHELLVVHLYDQSNQ